MSTPSRHDARHDTRHDTRHDSWAAGDSYERYMGRWSRQVAERYLDWLAAPKHARWLDLGCGTGALSQTILARCAPRSLIGIDPSAGFIAHARATTTDPRAQFEVGDAQKLPLPDASVDVAASALALNFVPDKIAALREIRRVVKPATESGAGLMSFYVWNYPGGGMGLMRAFWTAAIALDPKAADLGEGGRFAFCTPEGLTALCAEAGWPAVTVAPVEIETRFADFEDFWQPFTLGAGPAPAYCASLPEEHRARLKAKLQETLGTGSFALPARAWAVKAVR